MRAFILGAGLGTRLRPLTDHLPKPLVPLLHRPWAEWALEACLAAGARDFAINTHHLPEAWNSFGNEPDPAIPVWVGENQLPASLRSWRGHPLALFHEPVLLDTGGALCNLKSWVNSQSGPVLVHNGDIFSTLPLHRLVGAHRASGLPATLALRSNDGLRNVEIDPANNRVLDLRGARGIGPGTHAFTGIYCIEPDFLNCIRPPGAASVIPAFLELAAAGKLGAVVLDEGVWLDLGDPESYLQAHRSLHLAPRVHPQAQIDQTASVGSSVIGPMARIGHGAVLDDCVVWPGCTVPAGRVMQGEIVCCTCPRQPAG